MCLYLYVPVPVCACTCLHIRWRDHVRHAEAQETASVVEAGGGGYAVGGRDSVLSMLSGGDTRAHSRLTIADCSSEHESTTHESLHPELSPISPKHQLLPSVFQFSALCENASDSELFDTPRRQKRQVRRNMGLGCQSLLYFATLAFELCYSEMLQVPCFERESLSDCFCVFYLTASPLLHQCFCVYLSGGETLWKSQILSALAYTSTRGELERDETGVRVEEAEAVKGVEVAFCLILNRTTHRGKQRGILYFIEISIVISKINVAGARRPLRPSPIFDVLTPSYHRICLEAYTCIDGDNYIAAPAPSHSGTGCEWSEDGASGAGAALTHLSQPPPPLHPHSRWSGDMSVGFQD